STSEISSINKDYYFIFPNTSSGVANPMTLNINPNFNCGDGTCESYLGETPNTCCMDCLCDYGEYCDVDPDVPNFARCEAVDDVSLQVLSTSTPLVTDCSNTFDLNITLKVNNPPSSLPETISSTFKIGSEAYPATCYGGPEYYCPVAVNSPVDCGQGTFDLGPNEVTASITFNDGSNDMSLTLISEFPDMTVNHECECDSNLYCDIGSYKCRSEEAITLGITSLTSYLDDYDDGDPIELTAKIFNPPTDLTVISTSATLNLTGGHVSPGSPTCTGPSDDYEYNCSIPFQISGYSNDQSYTFDPNNLIFTITYLDGSIEKTKTLETNFGPVSIPSQFCGDGSCNMGETQASCCMDCGCSGPDDYCDAVSGCAPKSGVTLSAAAVSPVKMDDCKVPHVVNITLSAVNPPSTITLDNYYHINDNLPTGWNIECDDSGYGGVFYCHLTIPAIDGCKLPSYDIDNNKLNVTMSFDDGATTSTFYKRITKQVTVEFSDLSIIPIYHCGDGTCESDLGEGAGNCCIDCACSTNQYCDVASEGTSGSCKSKDAIKLIIDSPKAKVKLTSCETPHHVNIKAHIQGQPATMVPEQYFGKFNGSNAEMIHCNTESAYGETSNQGFNCTLTVPSQFVCENGKTYTYKDNSFSIMISYNNGGVTETKTLSAKLPNIVVTQTIQSIYDIMRESEQKLERSLKKIMEITEDMFNAYQTCMKIAVAVAIIATLATLYTMGKGIVKKWDSYEFRNKVGTVGDASAKIVQMITNICQLISQYYQIALTLEKVKMDMVKVEICTKLNQHMLDSGQCRGREESCFNSLIGCMNLANVDNWMRSMTGVTDQIQRTSQNIGNTFNNFMNDYGGGTYGDRRVNLLVKCNGKYMQPNGECCSHVSGKSTCGIGEKIYIRAEKTGYDSSSCNYPVVMLDDQESSSKTYHQDHVIDILGGQSEKEVTFTLRCYSSQSQYANDMSTGKMKTPKRTFTVKLINDDKCESKCGDSGKKSDPVPGAPTVESFTVNGKPDIDVKPGDVVEFEARITDNKDDEVTWELEYGESGVSGTEGGSESGCHSKVCYVKKNYEYGTEGTHTAKFTAIDKDNQKSEEKTVTITVSNDADSSPKIVELAPDKEKVKVGEKVTITAKVKNNDGGNIDYKLETDENQDKQTGNQDCSEECENKNECENKCDLKVEVKYTKPGVKTPQLTVTNTETGKESVPETTKITVTDESSCNPPEIRSFTINDEGSATVAFDREFTLLANIYCCDKDGSGENCRYYLKLGNQEDESDNLHTSRVDGDCTDYSSGCIWPKDILRYRTIEESDAPAGQYDFTLHVVDSDGRESSKESVQIKLVQPIVVDTFRISGGALQNPDNVYSGADPHYIIDSDIEYTYTFDVSKKSGGDVMCELIIDKGIVKSKLVSIRAGVTEQEEFEHAILNYADYTLLVCCHEDEKQNMNCKQMFVEVLDTCFLPGTKISTPYGEMDIEFIQSGDYVVSYNEYTGQNEISIVSDTFVHEYDGEYMVINDVLRVTPSHPMWINGEWEEAGSAEIGDVLIDIDGNIVVESIQYVDGVETVYNLEISNTHTYYAEGILVHNKANGGGGGEAPSACDEKCPDHSSDVFPSGQCGCVMESYGGAACSKSVSDKCPEQTTS
ncbi:polymorphic toxin-type HINT domain-containing protein, partial [Candidatus Aenigmatarchaeota archaeon]